VERKWRDALNIAAAELQAWEPDAPRKDRGLPDKSAGGQATGERPPSGTKGPTKAVGAANVVTQQPSWGQKKCRVQEQTGCEGDNLVLRCSKLRELSPLDRKKALEARRLCMFCLRHPANAECFDQRGRLKLACTQPGCKGKHAAGVHDLLGGVEASVSLVMEEDDKEDEGDLYVNVSRIGHEEDEWQEPDDSWLELDGGERTMEESTVSVPSRERMTLDWKKSSNISRISPLTRTRERRLKKTGGGLRICHGCSQRRRMRRRPAISTRYSPKSARLRGASTS
jgi:hypothetical protein